MKTFLEYLETVEETPPGIDPEMWKLASPVIRKALLAQYKQQTEQQPNPTQQQLQTQGWKPATQQKAAPFQMQSQYQSWDAIESALKTYLSRMPGFPTSGTLEGVRKFDLNLATEIIKRIKNKSIPLHNKQSDTFGQRGIHFYRKPDGQIAFVYNRR